MALARLDKAAPYSTPTFLLWAPAGISDPLGFELTAHQPYWPYPRVRLVSTHGHYHELGGPSARVVTSRMLEQLTYVQIGDRLNISSEGARAIVKRNRLPRSHDKNGKTLVAIDLDELQHKPLPVRSPRRLPVIDVVATLKARIEQLEAELAAEQQRSAGHRAHYEHERERADLLARSHEELDIQLKNLRLHLQAGRQAAAPRTLRDWWRWLRASG